MMRVLAGLAVAGVVLAACSGVPTSSSPKVIGGPVGGPSGTLPTNTPQPNAEPRAIVQEFLRANAVEPLEPRGAREFLTPDAQRRWSDGTVTVLQGSIDDAKVGVAQIDGSRVTVNVEGTEIGSLNAAGEYAPVQTADGRQPWSRDYSLELVKGQSRISNPTDGLVIYAADFAKFYQAIRLFFLDLREKRLVPDLRYSALGSKQALASWALNQLTSGPRQELTNAVRTEVPSLPAATPPSVALDDSTARVDIPGGSRLESDAKIKLAAQLEATLEGVQNGVQLSLTDGGAPVDVMGSNNPISVADFATLTSQPPDAQAHFFDGITNPPVFYLDGAGRLVTESGRPLDGPLGTRLKYDLDSVAITSARSENDYYVAACVGPEAHQTLWLGRASSGLSKVDVPSGRLTRPSWLAGQREVWIANGTRLYRADYSGAVQEVSPGLLPGATITAMRLSPEGSRIAMTVRETPTQPPKLFVGSIVRTDTVPTQGSSARIDGALPVLPPNYRVKDVAWADDVTLMVTGSLGAENGIWSVNVDGSDLTEVPTSGLPQPQLVDSVTVGRGTVAWVSAGGYVFKRGTDWEGPGRHTTPGRNPIYQDSYLD